MGFVKIPNDLQKWDWYDDNNTLAVYVRLLLGATWKERDYQNVHLKRGQIVTTLPQIAQQSKLTVQQVRTIINRLKSTGKITVDSMPKFSVITLIEYDFNSFYNRQSTDEQQSNNRQSTDEQQSNNRPTYIQKYRSTERHNDRNTEVVSALSASPTSAETVIQEFLITEYGEKVVSAYEKKFDAWKAKKCGIVRANRYETITKMIKEDIDNSEDFESWYRTYND